MAFSVEGGPRRVALEPTVFFQYLPSFTNKIPYLHQPVLLSRTFAPAYQAGKSLREKERLKKNENQIH